MNPKVDVVLKKAKQWRQELERLRTIILDCGLTEELKWYQPCYTFQKKNVLIIGGFKEFCVLSFFKGALLKDAQGILSRPGANTQVVRVVRFTNVQEIVELEPVLKAYIHEAIEVEKAGVKMNSNQKAKLKIPEELQNKLVEIPALKTAFAALTPGRQLAYVFYFSAPRQSKTREARIEKCMDQILDGKGLND
jgi:uncharacterized protein YdeI (YjbR/CyaY-like superfamily)